MASLYIPGHNQMNIRKYCQISQHLIYLSNHDQKLSLDTQWQEYDQISQVMLPSVGVVRTLNYDLRLLSVSQISDHSISGDMESLESQ